MRDPKQDPKVGDVLKRGSLRRHVTQAWADASYIECEEVSDLWLGVRKVMPLLSQWRKWCRSAEVVHVAE